MIKPSIRNNVFIAFAVCVAAFMGFVVYRNFNYLSFLAEEYGDFVLQQIERYMLIYGYWAVFFGVMLENASCGISTRPTFFIRFLPSFCFSSSLRLREMSPP